MVTPFFRHGLLAGILSLGLTWAAFAQMPDKPSPHLRAAITDFDAALAQQCPAKRLDLLSPADLSGAVETFNDLSPAEMAAAQKAEEGACAHNIAGVSCGNMQMILAIHQDHHMAAFAAHVCATPKTCTAQSVCPTAKP